MLLVGAILTELGSRDSLRSAFASLPLALLAIVVAGAGFGALLGAPTRYIVTNETPERSRAVAVGLLSQALIIGQILGSSLAGGLLAGTSETAGYRNAYLAFSAVAFLAMIFAANAEIQRDERRRPVEGAQPERFKRRRRPGHAHPHGG